MIRGHLLCFITNSISKSSEVPKPTKKEAAKAAP